MAREQSRLYNQCAVKDNNIINGMAREQSRFYNHCTVKDNNIIHGMAREQFRLYTQCTVKDNNMKLVLFTVTIVRDYLFQAQVIIGPRRLSKEMCRRRHLDALRV